VAEPAVFWPNAGAIASIVARVAIVILCILQFLIWEVLIWEVLGMRRAGADVEIDELGRLSQTIWGGFRSVNRPAMLVHEGCVLIKLLLCLLQCREMPGWTLVAFDMSQEQLMWFGPAFTNLKIKP
jgi:hypothetical protein